MTALTLFVLAVAVNRPGVPFARSAGEEAMPFESVTSVAWEPPLTKAAEAPVAPVPSAKSTLAPLTGRPLASSTWACSGCAKRVSTVADWLEPFGEVIEAATPLAVLVR